MARRFSIQSYTSKDLKVNLRFEAEELDEQGVVVNENLSNEITNYFTNTFETPTESTLENTAQTIYEFFQSQLYADPTNVYKNLMGDEYQRVKMISVEVVRDYTAIYGD